MHCKDLNLNKTDLKWKIIRRLEALYAEDSIFIGAVVLAIKDHPERFEQTIKEIISQYQDNPSSVEKMIGYKTMAFIIHYSEMYL